jgi:hypothetical protein
LPANNGSEYITWYGILSKKIIVCRSDFDGTVASPFGGTVSLTMLYRLNGRAVSYKTRVSQHLFTCFDKSLSLSLSLSSRAEFIGLYLFG